MAQRYRCEADVIEGLEGIAQAEIEQAGGRGLKSDKGIIRFAFHHDLRALLQLKTVLSVYLVQPFDVSRPKALLGDQHRRTLLAQIDAVRALMPHNAYRTFMLGAAGSHSAVMQRLKAEIAQHTSLREVDEEGEMLIRIRPATSPSPLEPAVSLPKGAGGHWDVLVRLSPKPLATRAWRVCNVAGSLQATVAHAMALLTQPKPNDVCLNLGCGSGTLLIERAMAGAAQRLIGCDIERKALLCAEQNIAAFRRGDRLGRPNTINVELHDWDARQLPLPDASVDALTADLPFGHRVGSHGSNAALYPAILREAARVSKPNARLVVIATEVRLMARTLEEMKSSWTREQSFRVNLGGLRPAIFVLRRV